MITPSSPSLGFQPKPSNYQKNVCLTQISKGKHSYRTLGVDFSIDMQVEYIPNSRLVLFNKELAQELNLGLPESDEELERIVLKNFSWFKYDKQSSERTANKITKTFFATRYKDSDDKSKGSALGDGYSGPTF